MRHLRRAIKQAMRDKHINTAMLVSRIAHPRDSRTVYNFLAGSDSRLSTVEAVIDALGYWGIVFDVCRWDSDSDSFVRSGMEEG